MPADLLSPGTVASIEAIAGILLLKGPPSGHARELDSTEAVCLAMGGNGGDQLKEAENNTLSGVALDTNGDKRFEGVSGEFGICGAVASAL